jgi:uroporphyrinogen decarboxylase
MTRRDRVIQVLQHCDTDIIPFQADFTQQSLERMIHYTGDRAFAEKVGNYIEGVYFDGFLQEESEHPGYFSDDFGVRWNRNGADKDIGVIDGIVIASPDISLIRMPEVKSDILNQYYREMTGNGRDTFKFGMIGFSMFERAWTLRGMENFLSDMLLDPDFAHALLDAICDFNLKIVDLALQYDIDGFHFGDDWGQQKGLIMGPRLWREFIKPRVARMYERVKSKGLFVSQHSCGDIHEVFPDLIEIGLDVYQTFQPEIYDIRSVKKEYGKDLSFWGGISTQRLLPFASPEEVKAKTIEIMKVMGADGGYIAAPTHAVPGDVPPGNILAMLEVFQHQEKYLK